MYGILFALLCVSYTRTYTQTHNVPFSKDDDWREEQQVHQNVIKTFSLVVSVYLSLLYQVPIQLISSSISAQIWITSVSYRTFKWILVTKISSHKENETRTFFDLHVYHLSERYLRCFLQFLFEF